MSFTKSFIKISPPFSDGLDLSNEGSASFLVLLFFLGFLIRPFPEALLVAEELPVYRNDIASFSVDDVMAVRAQNILILMSH